MGTDLNGKIAAITGGASGIGLATAEALLDAGATVVLVDRDAAALEKLRERLGPRMIAQVTDLLDPDSCAAIATIPVAITMLKINPMEYVNATMQMVPYKHVFIGLTYGTVFGVIIALTGCFQGMRCGRSAQAVGQATTTAVVQAIVGIIVSTAIITVICNVMDI